MIFVGLAKFRKRPDKNDIGHTTKIIAHWKTKGINMLKWYWTLGRYDAVVVFEAKSEKEAMKMSITLSECITSETLEQFPEKKQ